MSDETFIDVEHRALDRALAEVEFLAQKRTFAAADTRFADFRRTLEAHLAHEETVTFPEFARRTGDPHGALAVIRDQHRALEEALDRVSGALASGDYTTFCTSLDALDRLLAHHQHTEERLLGERPAPQPAP